MGLSAQHPVAIVSLVPLPCRSFATISAQADEEASGDQGAQLPHPEVDANADRYAHHSATRAALSRADADSSHTVDQCGGAS